MKWAKMTPEQRNELVATKIMGWTPESRCDITEDDVEEAWNETVYRCKICGYLNYDDRMEDHQTAILPYTTSMDAAWLVLRHVIKSKIGTKYTEAATTLRRWIVSDADIWGYDAEVAAELICKAALKACGVEIDQSPAEPQS